MGVRTCLASCCARSATRRLPRYMASLRPTSALGVVAGSMEFYADRGKLVAQLVRGAIAGKAVEPGRAVSSVPSRCVADARELARWALDERRLPDGCDVRFVERQPWRQYWWQIVVGLAILIGQALLIAALFVQRRRRRIAEAESQARLSEMAHMNRRVSMGELVRIDCPRAQPAAGRDPEQCRCRRNADQGRSAQAAGSGGDPGRHQDATIGAPATSSRAFER